MSLRLTWVLWGLCLVIPSVARAQTTPRGPGTWFYGISTGLGARTIGGTFSAADEPVGAGQPPSSRTMAALDLEGGLGLAGRLAVFATYEGGAALSDAHGWGTLAVHGSVRAWVTPRVWVEGGIGPAELAFRVPSPAATSTAYWWTPGLEAGAGYEIFQGPSVTLHVFARYTSARFDAVRVQSVFFQVGLVGRR
jgi:hypothetical protein